MFLIVQLAFSLQILVMSLIAVLWEHIIVNRSVILQIVTSFTPVIATLDSKKMEHFALILMNALMALMIAHMNTRIVKIWLVHMSVFVMMGV
uniref:Uncharacterized protein n=1 Tax=Arcella intermedia TaxID=1963864 RepID=A0A6B2LVH8_9EUKA